MTESLTPAQCREALRAVIDPEIYQNIVDLGLVYGVAVQPGNRVDVTMTLTTPHCPLGPQIITNVEQVLTELGASAVQVRIVWEPPWTPDAMTDDLKRELGILPETDDDLDEEPEPVLAVELPPPLPKKKGLFGRLFGF